MLGVNFRIDHGNENTFARCNFVGLLDLQFVQHVLGRITLRVGRGLESLFLQSEDIVGLRARDDLFVSKRPDDARNRTSAKDVQAVKGGIDQR